MLTFPNCKINLGLRILRRRDDGYHDLDTAFYPLPIKDVLEIIRSQQLTFTTTGLAIPGEPSTNLCLKAYHLLKKDFGELPPIHIHLHKVVPIGAGLGGGSADGAFMLLLLNRHFHLQLGEDRLISYAAQLGSDCSFFVLNKPSLGSSRGEVLEPIALDLSAYRFALVDPGVHISTAWAFSQCTPAENAMPIRDVIRQPVETWKGQLVNDFEGPVFRAHPALEKIKKQLYDAGAVYASMTGSGSAFFGIYPRTSKAPLPDASLFPDYFFSIV